MPTLAPVVASTVIPAAIKSVVSNTNNLDLLTEFIPKEEIQKKVAEVATEQIKQETKSFMSSAMNLKNDFVTAFDQKKQEAVNIAKTATAALALGEIVKETIPTLINDNDYKIEKKTKKYNQSVIGRQQGLTITIEK